MFFLATCFVSTLASAAHSQTESQLQNWHQWRGPFADGRSPTQSRPPLRWSRTSNIKWVADIPGEGTSTPIIWEGRVFVLSANATDRKSKIPARKDERSKTIAPDIYYEFIVSCFDRSTGKLLWQEVAVEEVPHEGHHPTHTFAGSSPTTDGERLYASFGSRGIFCYSLNGKLLWKTDLGDMTTRYGWGESVTPVIHDESLVINRDQEEGSVITCLDAATGNEKWTTPRPGEVTSWNTPLVTEHAGKWIVVVNGTEKVRAYDLASGTELWRCGGQTVNAIPSPIRFRENVIAMSGYRGAMAVSIPLDSVGDVTTPVGTAWAHSHGTPYVPSPLLSHGRLFFTGGNRNILTVLDAETGQAETQPRRLKALGNIYASPIAAGGHIFFLDRNGTCVVLKDEESLEVVAVNRLEDATDASPVIVGEQLFIRSWTRLYCIGS